MEETKVTHTPSIKLAKLTGDKFSWEIRVSDDDLEKAVKEIERINNLMKEKFKSNRGR